MVLTLQAIPATLHHAWNIAYPDALLFPYLFNQQGGYTSLPDVFLYGIIYQRI